ncbi:MAG: PKD domain-containing protein [Acidobacteria bacterium]|nr:PKD domain-containing protein [Acidobacteriota bacterium]
MLSLIGTTAFAASPPPFQSTDPGPDLPFYQQYPDTILATACNDYFLAVVLRPRESRNILRIYDLTTNTMILERSYHLFSNNFDPFFLGDKLVFSAQTSPGQGTLRLHIINCASQQETERPITPGLHRGTFIIMTSGNELVYDAWGDTSVLEDPGSSRAYHFRALIGDKILYHAGESVPGGMRWFPLLFSLPQRSEMWRDVSFTEKDRYFLDKRMQAGAGAVFDGFPVLMTGRYSATDPSPEEFCLVDSTGRCLYLSHEAFGLNNPKRVSIKTQRTVEIGGNPTLVVEIEAVLSSPLNQLEHFIAVIDTAGRVVSQTDRFFPVLDWTITADGHLLFLYPNRDNRHGVRLTSLSLPSLATVYDREIPYLSTYSGTFRGDHLIGNELYILGRVGPWGRTHPWGVLGFRTGDGMLLSYFPFENSIGFMKSPDSLLHTFNRSHLFVSMQIPSKSGSHTAISRLPRGYQAGGTAELSVPFPVYVDSQVDIRIQPSSARLTVSGGRLENTTWFTPSQPGLYIVNLWDGATLKEWAVDVLPLPDNMPPKASFQLLDPTESLMWEPTVGFSGETSSDPEGKLTNCIWTFGDGSQTEGIGYLRYVSHQYAQPGTYEVTLQVIDERNGTATTKRKIVVGKVLELKGRQWGIPAALKSENTAGYKIELTTGNVDRAGTDADVYIAFYGPKSDQGMRTGSGEIRLSPDRSSPYADPFVKNQTDTFTFFGSQDLFGKLEDIDFIVLRHDNQSKNAGWYIQSLSVTDLDNQKTWNFLPDQWLADDEPPDFRTFGRFTPLEDYPGGILLKGEKRSSGLTEASDNVFILPEGAAEFHMTMLDRSTKMKVFFNGILLGTQYSSGQGVIRFPFIREDEWGITLNSSHFTQPRKLEVRMTSGGKEETALVWVYPSSWVGYEKEARKLALLLPVNNQMEMFQTIQETPNYLKKQRSNLDLTPILNYGADALRIFGAWPDLKLKSYTETNTLRYTTVVARVAAKLAGRVASQVLGKLGTLLTSIIKAKEWADGLPEIINITATPAYVNDLLTHLAENDPNFRQALNLFRVLKTKMDSLVIAAEANNPSLCRILLEDIRTLTVGDHPDSEIQTQNEIDYSALGVMLAIGITSEHPLALILTHELERIQDWRSTGNTDLDYLIDLGVDRKEVTRIVMNCFEPVIETMIQVAGIFINASLLVGPNDPEWLGNR